MSEEHYEVMEEIQDVNYLENDISDIQPDLIQNNAYVQVRNHVQANELLEAKLIQEVKEKEEYDMLLKIDSKLDEMLRKLGIENLQNSDVKNSAIVLEKWGINIDGINKSKILACGSKNYLVGCENFVEYNKIKNMNKICQNKIFQISKSTSEIVHIKNVKNALAEGVKSNSNFGGQYVSMGENDVLPHEKITELVEKLEKKMEELTKLKEMREKLHLTVKQLKDIVEEIKKKKGCASTDSINS